MGKEIIIELNEKEIELIKTLKQELLSQDSERDKEIAKIEDNVEFLKSIAEEANRKGNTIKSKLKAYADTLSEEDLATFISVILKGDQKAKIPYLPLRGTDSFGGQLFILYARKIGFTNLEQHLEIPPLLKILVDNTDPSRIRSEKEKTFLTLYEEPLVFKEPSTLTNLQKEHLNAIFLEFKKIYLANDLSGNPDNFNLIFMKGFNVKINANPESAALFAASRPLINVDTLANQLNSIRITGFFPSRTSWGKAINDACEKLKEAVTKYNESNDTKALFEAQGSLTAALNKAKKSRFARFIDFMGSLFNKGKGMLSVAEENLASISSTIMVAVSTKGASLPPHKTTSSDTSTLSSLKDHPVSPSTASKNSPPQKPENIEQSEIEKLEAKLDLNDNLGIILNEATSNQKSILLEADELSLDDLFEFTKKILEAEAKANPQPPFSNSLGNQLYLLYVQKTGIMSPEKVVRNYNFNTENNVPSINSATYTNSVKGSERGERTNYAKNAEELHGIMKRSFDEAIESGIYGEKTSFSQLFEDRLSSRIASAASTASSRNDSAASSPSLSRGKH